jgi:tetratricopeptide (TPR) repeat protein
MWFLAPMMLGRFDVLTEVIDRTVEACRAHGYDWELGMALQLRAKVGNDVAGTMDRAAADADEALEVFTRLGDAWGIAEALAGRGEAREVRGAYAEAAEDYRRAVDHALGLRAHSQVPILKTRLGSVLLETGDPDDEAEGDRLLREAVAETEAVGDRPDFAKLQYALRLGRQGRVQEAREMLQPMATDSAGRGPQLFTGMVESLLAWLHVEEGAYRTGLEMLRGALPKLTDPMAQLVAPTLLYGQFLTAAWALAGLGRAADAVRLVGAFDTAIRTRVHSHDCANATERHLREQALAAVRAAGLAEAEHERAYAEGGGLSVEEAAALLGRDTD